MPDIGYSTQRENQVSDQLQQLRELRARRGISQKRAAVELGISASLLNLLENGKRPAPEEFIRKYSFLLRSAELRVESSEPQNPVVKTVLDLLSQFHPTNFAGLEYVV